MLLRQDTFWRIKRKPAPSPMRILLTIGLLGLAACSAPGLTSDEAAADSTEAPRRVSTASVVYGEDLMAAGSMDIEQALAARVPGLNLIAWRGQTILVIRGINTLQGDPSPLYVVDGMQTSQGLSPLRTLNVYDIDRIEVLKGAGQTAMYGIRGGNGVIRIWTRRPPPLPAEPDSTDG